ncbi:MAG: response regulator [Elusimicrobia bacterium]|nr:response regulator [Elusimicrobiota bacterium]
MAPEEGGLASAAEKRILIVDDEPDIVEVLEVLLRKEGFQIDTATDGQAALQQVMSQRPDLILLDLKLPKIQGLELLRVLQANEAGDVPIFIITGKMSNRETEQVVRLEPNVKGFYTKPVNTGLLAMNIHTFLGTKPATRGKSLGW